MDKYERYELDQKRNRSTAASTGGHGLLDTERGGFQHRTEGGSVLFVLICLGLFMYFKSKEDLPTGSNCIVAESAYGVRDLDKTYEALKRAQKVNDQFGIAELVHEGAAGLVPEGTHGLVIDSESHFLSLFSLFSSYRKIRVLDGDFTGKALWFKKSVLRGAESPLGPCRDPHEHRGSTGVCFCEPGWKTDPTTLKCLPQ